MLRRVDLVYQDLKHADPERHRELTGRDNAPILNNLELLKSSGRPFVIRIPVIPGCNGDMDNMEACAGLVSGAGNLLQVQLLPYNPAAPAKSRAAGREFGLDPESLSAVDWKRLRAVFLREKKISIFLFLQNYRMAHARRLLQQPYCDIKEVAFQCGYPDAGYFARQFKKIHLCSPTEFRFNLQTRPEFDLRL